MQDQKKNSPTTGSGRYILQFERDGAKYAATSVGGKFALAPISENRVKGTVLAFDTPADVLKFLKELKQKSSPEDWDRLCSMRPRYVLIHAIH